MVERRPPRPFLIDRHRPLARLRDHNWHFRFGLRAGNVMQLGKCPPGEQHQSGRGVGRRGSRFGGHDAGPGRQMAPGSVHRAGPRTGSSARLSGRVRRRCTPEVKRAGRTCRSGGTEGSQGTSCRPHSLAPWRGVSMSQPPSISIGTVQSHQLLHIPFKKILASLKMFA